jgi:hypothetical protein
VPPDTANENVDPKFGDPEVRVNGLWSPLFIVNEALDEAIKAVLDPIVFVTTTE